MLIYGALPGKALFLFFTLFFDKHQYLNVEGNLFNGKL